jgi:hypothetical protein
VATYVYHGASMERHRVLGQDMWRFCMRLCVFNAVGWQDSRCTLVAFLYNRLAVHGVCVAAAL